MAGSADTGIDMEVIAANIVSKGIAFVSINYRLGPLGFMNYQNGDKLEGNFGIWDMVMALQWIQSNMKQVRQVSFSILKLFVGFSSTEIQPELQSWARVLVVLHQVYSHYLQEQLVSFETACRLVKFPYRPSPSSNHNEWIIDGWLGDPPSQSTCILCRQLGGVLQVS